MAGYFQQHLLMATPAAILDWGCGLARVVQFLPETLPGGNYFGCDINSTRIRWNKSHHPAIAFSAITGITLPYANQQFDGIYGLSVLTHIDAASQLHWLKELHRILKPGGILIVSTQGESYYHQLNPAQLKNLIHSAAFSNPYQEDGHRMMSTYHHAPHFKQELENIFSVLEYYNGKSHPALLGGQDLWIVRRT